MKNTLCSFISQLICLMLRRIFSWKKRINCHDRLGIDGTNT